jgi:hypothetical protein
VVFGHGGRKSPAVGMAAAAISRLAGPCQFFSDRYKNHGTPPQRQSRLAIWRRPLDHYCHEETGPRNHHAPPRKATNSKKRFLTPFVPPYAPRVRNHEQGCKSYAAVNFSVAINQRLREFCGTIRGNERDRNGFDRSLFSRLRIGEIRVPDAMARTPAKKAENKKRREASSRRFFVNSKTTESSLF